jgi:hypothetical protein
LGNVFEDSVRGLFADDILGLEPLGEKMKKGKRK